MNPYDGMLEKLSILSDAENLFLIYMNDINDQENKENFQNLFSFFDENILKQPKEILLDFFILINHITLSRPLSKQYYMHIFNFIDYALSKLQEGNMIHFDDIFNIFRQNNYMILHFFNHGIMKKEDFVDFFQNLSFSTVNIQKIHFFMPEIVELSESKDSKLISLIDEKFNIKEEYNILKNNKDKLEQFKINRDHCSLCDPILHFIIDDEIDDFIKFISKNNFDIDEKFNDIFLSNSKLFNNSINILEVVMGFGSFSILKYLFLNSTLSEKLTQKSLQYAIIGRNYDIIHYIEEKTKLEFDDNCLKLCIEQHDEDIYNYISENYNISINILEEYEITFNSCNFTHLQALVSKDKTTFNNMCSSGTIIRRMLSTKSMFLIYFVLSLPDIDINQCNSINSIVYNLLILLNGILLNF